MKLLLDANLSFRLVEALTDLYSHASHVRDVGLESAGDEVIWSFAQRNGYIIVSKDSDFRHLSFVYGAPPKVISIARGELSTSGVIQLLRAAHERIEMFVDAAESFLVLD